MGISFNRPYLTGDEKRLLDHVLAGDHFSGNGNYTRRCHEWLVARTGARSSLLTQSGTHGLEMAALLAQLAPGDEVIMPSFTFVSTANAFVLRGAVPVFIDIRSDTLNLDETLIEEAITERTRAIVVVHYAGVACEMDSIMALARQHGLLVIEDNAHGLLASYRGQPLGSIGHLAALSFHETKNIISGEGGALLINEPGFVTRSEVLWEKGTNRAQFFRGEVDKYTWVDVGSSFLPSELTAAFLYAQLQHADEITTRRMAVWDAYHAGLEALERDGALRRPRVPLHCQHNAHAYYVLLPDLARRDAFLAAMKQKGIGAIFHYIPLHSSPAGRRYARVHGSMAVTDEISGRLARLPLWAGMEQGHVDAVLTAIRDVVGSDGASS